jgi:hypothetical protein
VLPIYLLKGAPKSIDPYNPAAAAAPVAPPAKKMPKKHAIKPPLASKSAKVLLAQIQREATEKKVKKGPMSTKAGKAAVKH